MVWHHPAIGQIDVFLELNRQHFRVNLHDSAFQPIAHPFTDGIFVIAINLHPITYLVWLPLIGSRGEVNIRQDILLTQAESCHFLCNGFLQAGAHSFEGNALHNRVKESFYD